MLSKSVFWNIYYLTMFLLKIYSILTCKTSTLHELNGNKKSMEGVVKIHEHKQCLVALYFFKNIRWDEDPDIIIDILRGTSELEQL